MTIYLALKLLKISIAEFRLLPKMPLRDRHRQEATEAEGNCCRVDKLYRHAAGEIDGPVSLPDVRGE